MKKTEIIKAIFGDSQKGRIIYKMEKSISKKYLIKCFSFYEKQDDKQKAAEFIFGLLNR